MLAKNLLAIMILHQVQCALTYSSNKSESPLETLRMTLLIYLLFIMFNRMDLGYSIVVFVLFSLMFVTNSYIAYFNATSPQSCDKIDMLAKAYDVIIGNCMCFNNGGGIYHVFVPPVCAAS